MLSTEIRASFLEYYMQRGHTLVPSASLVPVADPSLLLINAGMAPLKRYFMAQEAPPAPRACSSQKCVRTVDIDQVGHTYRHNTFFEMLGKFSFGDYFKEQAMRYSLEWMTSKDWMAMDPARIYITHHERDEESRKLWLTALGWPEARLFALGDKDNLWAAGDTGPWGYDTEYFWDFAPDGKPVDVLRFEELVEAGRILEVGNDVFMQFMRDEHGAVTDLPKKNVDYGGGLERFTMVKQDVRSVYQTDCMDYLIRGFAEVVTSAAKHSPSDDELFALDAHRFNPYWLAADHIRTATFLLGDGVTPGNLGRNYVPRRLIRRIIAQAYRLGVRQPFIMRLADLVIGMMGTHYVELKQNRDKLIAPWIEKEEAQFFKVMETGWERLSPLIEQCEKSVSPMPGAVLFELYDTYGFPFDIARELCVEQGVAVEGAEYERLMDEQRERARGAAKFEGDMGEQEQHGGEAIFTGYLETASEATVLSAEALPDIRKIAPLIAPANATAPVPGVRLITDRTPFYSASGGQPDDRGWLPLDGQNYAMQATAVRGVHIVLGEPGVEAGSHVVLAVDVERRHALRRPHTTNHLMLKAMKQVLGEHVSQAGSQLDEDEIRFDFSHFQAVTADELRRIEVIVNRWILEDHPVTWMEMPLLAAKQMGVTAVFDEKYGASVRVVSVGSGEEDSLEGWVSRELCGGTHMDHTSQAGAFLIVKEESVQSGIRRVYGLTGYKALAYIGAARSAVDWLGAHYKRPLPNPCGLRPDEYEAQAQGWRDEALGKIEHTELKLRDAHQAAIEARREAAIGALLPSLVGQACELGGRPSLAASPVGRAAVPASSVERTAVSAGEESRTEPSAPLESLHILCAAVSLPERDDVKFLVERFAGGLWKDNYAVFIAAEVGGKAALACKVSPEAVARGIKAKELIQLAAKICGGGGGGRDDFAEAGGKDATKCADAAAAVQAKIGEVLQ